MTQLESLLAELNSNTNLVAAKLDKLIAQIAADQGQMVTPEVLAGLQSVSDHLKALGADPVAPLPPVAVDPAPVAPVDPAPTA